MECKLMMDQNILFKDQTINKKCYNQIECLKENIRINMIILTFNIDSN